MKNSLFVMIQYKTTSASPCNQKTNSNLLMEAATRKEFTLHSKIIFLGLIWCQIKRPGEVLARSSWIEVHFQSRCILQRSRKVDTTIPPNKKPSRTFWQNQIKVTTWLAGDVGMTWGTLEHRELLGWALTASSNKHVSWRSLHEDLGHVM